MQKPYLAPAVLFLTGWIQAAPALANPGDSLDHQRLRRFTLAAVLGYGACVTALSQVWYNDYDKQRFRFFDDSHEWYQADKMGHFYATARLDGFLFNHLKRYGLSEGKAAAVSAVSAFLAVSTIEVLDGYSSGYGASASDLAANGAGALFHWGQQQIWKEQRIIPRFSFHTTRFASLRPGLLGSGLGEELIKDYNGQTYWLSVDADKFVRFPKWLNLAVGYGVEGFVFAEPSANRANGYDGYRQYYLGIDFDLKDIPTRSGLVRTLLQGLSLIRLPAPALELGKKGLKFHPFYF